jgi:hypothetical protein
MSAIIFAGPSLPPRLRPADPRLTWRPPVRQGEVYRAALEGPAAIGVIDGYFEVVPTVWHKEILWAMSRGIHVFGAASVGALRAAELEMLGMKGVGRIYEDFRDGVLEDDDEVALLHGPEELGYPALTEAMVDIRATLAAAAACGVLDPAGAAGITAIAKTRYYKERTYPAILAEAAVAGVPAVAIGAFAAWLSSGRVEQKHADAAALAAEIGTYLAQDGRPLAVGYQFADTAAWRAARARADA